MSNPQSCRSAARRRSAIFLTLGGAALLGLAFACERPAGSTGEAGTTSAAGDAGTSKLPTPDTSKFPTPARAAFADWHSRLGLNPRDADLAVNLGALCYVHGSPQDAVAFIRRAAELEPEHRIGH